MPEVHRGELRKLKGDLAAALLKLQTQEKDLRKAKDARNTSDRKVKELEQRAADAEARAEKAEQQPKAEPVSKSTKPLGKIKNKQTQKRRARMVAAQLGRQHADDVVPVLINAVRRVATKKKLSLKDLVAQMVSTRAFASFRAQAYRMRDDIIYKHLREQVFTPEAFALLRLVLNDSKRECHIVAQSFKYDHLPNGKKKRRMLAPDSHKPVPPIFDVADIIKTETAALQKTGVTLHEGAERRSADVGGAPFSLDRHMQNLHDAASSAELSRSGGMAAAGTASDPDICCVTGDGAQVSGKYSIVDVGVFWGSTEYLSQSSMDVASIAIYLEAKGAEDYVVLKARLSNVLPQLRRIFKSRHPSPPKRRPVRPLHRTMPHGRHALPTTRVREALTQR